jgi:hypothetical protein
LLIHPGMVAPKSAHADHRYIDRRIGAHNV